jgi:hypothetical protein
MDTTYTVVFNPNIFDEREFENHAYVSKLADTLDDLIKSSTLTVTSNIVKGYQDNGRCLTKITDPVLRKRLEIASKDIFFPTRKRVRVQLDDPPGTPPHRACSDLSHITLDQNVHIDFVLTTSPTCTEDREVLQVTPWNYHRSPYYKASYKRTNKENIITEICNLIGEEVWQNITDYSRTWIITGCELLWGMNDLPPTKLDLIVSSICKALEYELARVCLRWARSCTITGERHYKFQTQTEQALWDCVAKKKKPSLGNYPFVFDIGHLSQLSQSEMIESWMYFLSTLQIYNTITSKIYRDVVAAVAKIRNDASHTQSVTMQQCAYILDNVIGTLNSPGILSKSVEPFSN